MYIDRLPEELISKLKATEQPVEYHPEKTVWNHMWLVEKQAEKYHDPILEMCAVFHDLGKIDVMREQNGKTVFYGHEIASLRYIEEYKKLFNDVKIENWDIVKWVVLNHMKAHVLDEMRPFKREKIVTHPWYEYLVRFNECDNKGRGEMPNGYEQE